MASEFNRQGIPFFNRDVYDLFYMGYGDTVPATGFISAGMTYEKNNGEPDRQARIRAVRDAVGDAVAGAIRKRAILEGWASAWREAYEQGQAGFLEPNEIVNPGNEVATEVPDRPLRHYFITERRESKQREVQAMIRRLQRMDVDVYRLAKRTWVPDFTPYGRSTRGQWMARGTWYVPMAQMQKHWVQAMLNEDTYTPFPYFYDVTAWSQPLLFNVRGGYSGERLRLRARGVDELADPGAPAAPADAPRIAVFQLSENSTSAIESTGWLRYLLERVWDCRTTSVDAGADRRRRPQRLRRGADPATARRRTARDRARHGRRADALRAWVNGGGHLIGWRGGTRFAAQLGLTTALAERAATSDVPGSLFRVRVDDDTPLRRGVGAYAWAFYEYDWVMRASSPDARGGRVPARRQPTTGSSRASPRAPRSSAARPRWSTSRSAQAGRPSSRSSRTSAPSRPASRRSCATRCSAPSSKAPASPGPAPQRVQQERLAPGAPLPGSAARARHQALGAAFERRGGTRGARLLRRALPRPELAPSAPS